MLSRAPTRHCIGILMLAAHMSMLYPRTPSMFSTRRRLPGPGPTIRTTYFLHADHIPEGSVCSISFVVH